MNRFQSIRAQIAFIGMMRPRWLSILALALTAAISSWYLWRLSEQKPAPTLVGPPRSDYVLESFELVALNEQGSESFEVQGPRLTRHPFLGTLTIESPDLRFIDKDQQSWQASARNAWVAADGNEVALRENVRVIGPAEDDQPPMQLTTEQLSLFPRQSLIANETDVTVTAPGSILRGRALRGDLAAKRFDLSQHYSIHEPIAP